MAAVTVLLNSTSGRAGLHGIDTRIATLFATAGSRAEVHVLQRQEDVADAARAAGTGGSIVVAAGGDGTVSQVASGVIDVNGILGILPLGTLNHFAKDLHLPLGLEEAIDTIASGRVGRVDVGQVNDRVFVNNASIGLYPSIVDVRDQLRRQGHRKWTAMAMATLRVLRRYRGMRMRIEVDGREHVWRTPFVFVGNNQYTVDGVSLGSRASLNSGRLFVYLTPRVRTRHLPRLLLKAIAGRASGSGDFEILSGTTLRIDTLRPRRLLRVAFDGELARLAAPLHFRAWPGALKVMLSRA